MHERPDFLWMKVPVPKLHQTWKITSHRLITMKVEPITNMQLRIRRCVPCFAQPPKHTFTFLPLSILAGYSSEELQTLETSNFKRCFRRCCGRDDADRTFVSMKLLTRYGVRRSYPEGAAITQLKYLDPEDWEGMEKVSSTFYTNIMRELRAWATALKITVDSKTEEILAVVPSGDSKSVASFTERRGWQPRMGKVALRSRTKGSDTQTVREVRAAAFRRTATTLPATEERTRDMAALGSERLTNRALSVGDLVDLRGRAAEEMEIRKAAGTKHLSIVGADGRASGRLHESFGRRASSKATPTVCALRKASRTLVDELDRKRKKGALNPSQKWDAHKLAVRLSKLHEDLAGFCDAMELESSGPCPEVDSRPLFSSGASFESSDHSIPGPVRMKFHDQ
jgi:hypothetical protein